MINKHLATKSKQEAPVPPETLRRLRVLIVEDEPILAIELESLFEALSVDVVGTADSAEGAELLAGSCRPDFVTMDINIKGDRDGVSAALGVLDKYAIPSIFVSAYNEASALQGAERCHAIGWIRKPVTQADLAELLGQIKRLEN